METHTSPPYPFQGHPGKDKREAAIETRRQNICSTGQDSRSRQNRAVGFSDSAFKPLWLGASSSPSQPSRTSSAVKRQEAWQGRQARAAAGGTAALVLGALVYFNLRFTSVIRLHLLTTSLPSVNPVSQEAEPMSCRASRHWFVLVSCLGVLLHRGRELQMKSMCSLCVSGGRQGCGWWPCQETHQLVMILCPPSPALNPMKSKLEI